MKIVFSRKGFDSSRKGSELPNGGVPSPIFPDGTALSLPIPRKRSPTRFRDVIWRGKSIGPIVRCLTKGRVNGQQRCHLDPDLNADALERLPGWRPAFGQVGRAQRHLENEGVGPGDLFLFFGWFRAVERANGGSWKYVRTAPKVHMLFGWLQVQEVLTLHADADYDRAIGKYPWLSDHPHLQRSFREAGDNLRRRPDNTIYVSSPRLSIAGTNLPGGGVFQRLDYRFILTEPAEVERGASCRRSYWRLPEWFWPANARPLLSRKVKFRRRDAPWTHVDSGGIGQEFVFDIEGIFEAESWLRSLFDN